MAKSRSEMGVSENRKSDDKEDKKVDILECGDTRDELTQEKEVVCIASSSSSSSFGDSMCSRDDDGDGGGEEEAQSMLSRDYPLHETCDDVNEFLGLRKKKVTDEWRRFSQSIMWRIKWFELKAKELQSQAKGYEKEFRSYQESKQFDLEKLRMDGFQGKSIPFRDHTRRMKVFKRGRRRRVEDTTDVAAYMSNHNVFSYADKRMPATLKAQYLDPDFGTGRKATSKEDVVEDDCLVSELDCSDDLLAKILCKIDEAQERARRLRKRVDLLTVESETAHELSTPETIAPCQRDLTVQDGKQCALVEEPLITAQREATVQIGRQRISADHTEDLLVPQAPPIQCLNNNSPISSGGFGFHPILEDLLMDNYETEMDDDKLDHFMKIMNDITGVADEEEEEEDDPTPVTKKRKPSR